MKKICVVTGTRAEYGLLTPLMKGIVENSHLELQLVVTGMHLSPEFGNTKELIQKDGFHINEEVEILLSSDTSIGISKSMGLALISFSEVFNRLKPDMIVLLGDRYEAFAVAAAASVAKIPIAHIHGGETTEGAFDEAFRHSITKMSWLHFTSTDEYRQRVIQLGENPKRVFNVGAIGIENIKNMPLLDEIELEKSLDIKIKHPLMLATFHPVTLEDSTSEHQFIQLLDALEKFKEGTIIFTKANSDTDGRIINKMIDEFVKQNPNHAVAYTSMGQLRYLSAMKIADIVIGNSSSGIIEAPSFNVPTINIGDRQKGRIQAESTINCEPFSSEIEKAIDKALKTKKLLNITNPYGDGEVSKKIVSVIEKSLKDGISLKKSFFDIS